MDRAGKQELVTTLNTAFKSAGSIVVAHYAGLTVAQLQNLRRQMKSKGATVKVSKNRLTKLALDGTGVADLSPILRGPTIIAFAKDPVTAPKVATDFAKGHDKFVVLGGALGGTALDTDGVKALATMPPIEELRAKLLGVLLGPATKLAGLLQAPGGQLARVIAAHAKKDEAA